MLRMKENTMIKKKRTLYECAHARVKGQEIYCRQGYPFILAKADGSLDIRWLAEGHHLSMAVYQHCGDFSSLGMALTEDQRGWLKKEEDKRRKANRKASPGPRLLGKITLPKG
jgi:hypothetical protein